MILSKLKYTYMLNFIKILFIYNFRKMCLEILKRAKSHKILFKSSYIPYQIGKKAEEIARVYLEKHGLKFIQRNFRCRMGEIDLIMKDGNEIVFVEVRIRSSNFISAIETITSEKKIKIAKTAVYYLQRHGLFDKVNYRFDVIAIDKIHKVYQQRVNFLRGVEERAAEVYARYMRTASDDNNKVENGIAKRITGIQWIKYAF